MSIIQEEHSYVIDKVIEKEAKKRAKKLLVIYKQQEKERKRLKACHDKLALKIGYIVLRHMKKQKIQENPVEFIQKQMKG